MRHSLGIGYDDKVVMYSMESKPRYCAAEYCELCEEGVLLEDHLCCRETECVPAASCPLSLCSGMLLSCVSRES